jgi:hypothetical protein
MGKKAKLSPVLKKQQAMRRLVEPWMIEHWNKRCKAFTIQCPGCMAWACFDYIFGNTQEQHWLEYLQARKKEAQHG